MWNSGTKLFVSTSYTIVVNYNRAKPQRRTLVILYFRDWFKKWKVWTSTAIIINGGRGSHTFRFLVALAEWKLALSCMIFYNMDVGVAGQPTVRINIFQKMFYWTCWGVWLLQANKKSQRGHFLWCLPKTWPHNLFVDMECDVSSASRFFFFFIYQHDTLLLKGIDDIQWDYTGWSMKEASVTWTRTSHIDPISPFSHRPRGIPSKDMLLAC